MASLQVGEHLNPVDIGFRAGVESNTTEQILSSMDALSELRGSETNRLSPRR